LPRPRRKDNELYVIGREVVGQINFACYPIGFCCGLHERWTNFWPAERLSALLFRVIN